MHSALFLDLGGTLLRIEDDEIYISPEGGIDILPNVIETLSQTTEDFIFVVTNQSLIEKGELSNAQIETWIEQIFNKAGKAVTDFWACPAVGSTYRKPSPSMVLALADKHYVDLAKSTYVGDGESDIKCASAAGVANFVWAKDYFGWIT